MTPIATNAEFRAGNVALMNMWGSAQPLLVEVDGVPQAVKDGFAIAGSDDRWRRLDACINPVVGWLDRCKNIATKTLKPVRRFNAIDPCIVESERETATQAVWLIDGYQPTPAAVGVFAAARWAQLHIRCCHIRLVAHCTWCRTGDFMQGKESAEQALGDIDAAYIAAAKEKGFL